MYSLLSIEKHLDRGTTFFDSIGYGNALTVYVLTGIILLSPLLVITYCVGFILNCFSEKDGTDDTGPF